MPVAPSVVVTPVDPAPVPSELVTQRGAIVQYSPVRRAISVQGTEILRFVEGTPNEMMIAVLAAIQEAELPLRQVSGEVRNISVRVTVSLEVDSIRFEDLDAPPGSDINALADWDSAILNDFVQGEIYDAVSSEFGGMCYDSFDIEDVEYEVENVDFD